MDVVTTSAIQPFQLFSGQQDGPIPEQGKGADVQGLPLQGRPKGRSQQLKNRAANVRSKVYIICE